MSLKQCTLVTLILGLLAQCMMEVTVLEIIHIIISVLSAILSVAGNIFIIFLIIKYDYLQTKSNIFVVALAISDMLVHLLALPGYIVSNEQDNSNITDTQYDSWESTCRLSVITNIISYYGIFQCVAAICIDRFLYIKTPYR